MKSDNNSSHQEFWHGDERAAKALRDFFFAYFLAR